MQRTRFGDMACSIASTLDVIGEPWSPLIVRDVWLGIRRFDEIRADLGISRKVLTGRLKFLVEAGVLAKEQYSERPVRSQYVLTAKGLDLVELLMVMVKWGDRWTAGDAGPPVLYRHQTCGKVAHVELHCSACNKPMSPDNIDLLPGTAH
jgi:DNA-binding HxlR family transcriptional regulator